MPSQEPQPRAIGPGIFFVHIMKTGGTSLHMLLCSWFPPEDIYPSPTSADSLWEKALPARLFESRAGESAPRRLYSVHMPAWVADEVAPDHARITLLREPLARTVSHLQQILRQRPEFGSLEHIYDDTQYRTRLANYQVRMLSSRRDDDMPAAASDSSTHPHEAVQLPPGAFLPELATAVTSDQPVASRAELDRATATLDRFEFVGVTEHLAAFASRLAQRYGMPDPNVGHAMRGSGPTASRSLIDRIRADNALDAELYERARARAAD